MEKIVLKYLGEGGFPFHQAVPARDLTEEDLAWLEEKRGITKKFILAIRGPLYEEVKLEKAKGLSEEVKPKEVKKEPSKEVKLKEVKEVTT